MALFRKPTNATFCVRSFSHVLAPRRTHQEVVTEKAEAYATTAAKRNDGEHATVSCHLAHISASRRRVYVAGCREAEACTTRPTQNMNTNSLERAPWGWATVHAHSAHIGPTSTLAHIATRKRQNDSWTQTSTLPLRLSVTGHTRKSSKTYRAPRGRRVIVTFLLRV